MNKELEALEQLGSLIENLTRIDYMPLELRQEVKQLLINAYEESNGLFFQLKEALKRNEPMKVDLAVGTWDPIWFVCPKCERLHVKDFYNYCPMCGQKLNWSDEK